MKPTFVPNFMFLPIREVFYNVDDQYESVSQSVAVGNKNENFEIFLF